MILATTTALREQETIRGRKLPSAPAGRHPVLARSATDANARLKGVTAVHPAAIGVGPFNVASDRAAPALLPSRGGVNGGVPHMIFLTIRGAASAVHAELGGSQPAPVCDGAERSTPPKRNRGARWQGCAQRACSGAPAP